MPDATNGTNAATGKIVEIKGVVIDVVFSGELPEIYSALSIEVPAQEGQETRTLIAEVQQHLGDDRVRAVAMDATDGLARGAVAYDTGAPISVPACASPVRTNRAFPEVRTYSTASREPVSGPR